MPARLTDKTAAMIPLQPCCGAQQNPYTYNPVSYTHLDVYKRQHLCRTHFKFLNMRCGSSIQKELWMIFTAPFVCSFQYNAGGRTWTGTRLPPSDFESDASAIPPRRQSCDRISPSRSRTIYHIIPSFILQPHFSLFTPHSSSDFIDKSYHIW